MKPRLHGISLGAAAPTVAGTLEATAAGRKWGSSR
jgi:hypothetical protein